MHDASALSRRSFLAAAACAAAGVPAVPRLATPFPRLRLGLIGCGTQGLRHLAILDQLARSQALVLAGVSDACAPRRTKAVQWSGAASYPRWEAVMACPNIDAVIIATPDYWHLPMLSAALECGKHVYVEPPLTLDGEALKSLCARWPDAGRRVHVSLPACHQTPWPAVARLIASGRLGALRRSQLAIPGFAAPAESATLAQDELDGVDWKQFYGPVTPRACEPRHFHAWRRYQAFSHGVLTALHFACLPPLLQATGDTIPAKVSVAGGAFSNDPGAAPDACAVTLEYPSTHTITLVANAAPAARPRQILRGECAAVEFKTDGAWLFPEDGPSRRFAPPQTTGHEGLAEDLAQWIARVRGGEEDAGLFNLACRAQDAASMAMNAYCTRRAVPGPAQRTTRGDLT